MAHTVIPNFEIELAKGYANLTYGETGLFLDYFRAEKANPRVGAHSHIKITPEIAREMKSIIDLYLYSLYIKEVNI